MCAKNKSILLDYIQYLLYYILENNQKGYSFDNLKKNWNGSDTCIII